MKPKVGTQYVCTTAATNFYKQGAIYELVERGDKLGFIGEDGLFDTFGKTTSKFVILKTKENLSE